MLKRILRSQAFVSAAGIAAASYIKLVRETSRLVRDPARSVRAPGCRSAVHRRHVARPVPDDPRPLPRGAARPLHGRAARRRRGRRPGAEEVRHGPHPRRRRRKRKRDRGGVHALRAALKALEDGQDRRHDGRSAARPGASGRHGHRDAGAALRTPDHSDCRRDEPLQDAQHLEPVHRQPAVLAAGGGRRRQPIAVPSMPARPSWTRRGKPSRTASTPRPAGPMRWPAPNGRNPAGGPRGRQRRRPACSFAPTAPSAALFIRSRGHFCAGAASAARRCRERLNERMGIASIAAAAPHLSGSTRPASARPTWCCR